MLNVLICAFESGILKIEEALPAPKSGINYFISWQGDSAKLLDPPLGLTLRNDVKISRLYGKGLSKNRNHCIQIAKESQARGYFLISDEDVGFLDDFDKSILQGFRDHQAADILCFQVLSDDSVQPFKNYSTKRYKLSMKTIDRISSIEIAGKMEVLDQIKFDERLGLGTEFPSGEETAFLADCLRAGKNIIYLPKSIVIHPYETSAKNRINKFSDEALELIGGRAYRIYGSILVYPFFLYSALKNYSKYKKDRSIFSYLNQFHKGIIRFKKLRVG